MPSFSICIDARLMFYRTAGIATYTRRLVRAMAGLCAPDAALSVLLDLRDADTAWIPANVDVVRTVTPAHHTYERLALPMELAARQILNSKFAILHSPDFITVPGRFRKVITIHDLYFMEHPEVMSADATRYYGQMAQSAARADKIIAVSRFTAGDIARLLPHAAHKVVVVHEAGDDLRIQNGEWRKANAQSPISNSPSRFLLFVGTLEPRKNLATLLRALARLPDEVRLVVVGADGWGDAGLDADATVRERITWAGRVSDAQLDELYRGARALVLPALSEGFGLPVLEAMARGTPVVCSRSGSLPEIAGDAALFHAPLDDAQLAHHIDAVWHNDALHADLARRGLARAAEFSWTRAAQETLAVYRGALDASAGAAVS